MSADERLSDGMLAQLAAGQAGGTYAMLASEIIALRVVVRVQHEALAAAREYAKGFQGWGDSIVVAKEADQQVLDIDTALTLAIEAMPELAKEKRK